MIITFKVPLILKVKEDTLFVQDNLGVKKLPLNKSLKMTHYMFCPIKTTKNNITHSKNQRYISICMFLYTQNNLEVKKVSALSQKDPLYVLPEKKPPMSECFF